LIGIASSSVLKHPEILKCAAKKLLPFPTTYLCESGFPWQGRPKTKYRSNVDAEEDLRVQLSPIIPDLKFMCSSNSLIRRTEKLTYS